MEEEHAELRHRGRVITRGDIAFIRELMKGHPEASRRRLSEHLCEAWDWRQANGVLRSMVARGLMLLLHRRGEIELPERRGNPSNPLVQRRRPRGVEVDMSPLKASLRELGPLSIRQVRRSGEEPLFNSLIESHHYLGYTQPVGEHLKHLVYAQGRPIACVAWSSAPGRLGPRDRYIGWSEQARARNIHLVAYNTRYLIMPWVQVPHLASHLLGRLSKELAGQWQELYGHPVHFVHTFVDPARYRGTCYRAANWVSMGLTTGRGHNAPTQRPRVPVKEVLGYGLRPRWRQLLSA